MQLKDNASQSAKGSNEPTHVDEIHLCYEEIDGYKKRWIYGLGSQASAYFYLKLSMSGSYSPAPQKE